MINAFRLKIKPHLIPFYSRNRDMQHDRDCSKKKNKEQLVISYTIHIFIIN